VAPVKLLFMTEQFTLDRLSVWLQC
jgi:hypothetical protein